MSRVPELMDVLPDSARDTVDVETPVRCATSSSVVEVGVAAAGPAFRDFISDFQLGLTIIICTTFA
jgi:hypothetical protein